MFVINTTCSFCGKDYPVQFRRVADYNAWQNDKHAQDAFPYLSADEREMLISGICPKCWADAFNEEEDEECFEPGRPCVNLFELNP